MNRWILFVLKPGEDGDRLGDFVIHSKHRLRFMARLQAWRLTRGQPKMIVQRTWIRRATVVPMAKIQAKALKESNRRLMRELSAKIKAARPGG